MAWRIIWSLLAQSQRREILDYWNNRNKSKAYSKKLNQLFREAVQLIGEYPQIGKLTNDGKARVKIVKHYLIIYETLADAIHILAIWDNRQDAGKLIDLLK